MIRAVGLLPGCDLEPLGTFDVVALLAAPFDISIVFDCYDVLDQSPAIAYWCQLAADVDQGKALGIGVPLGAGDRAAHRLARHFGVRLSHVEGVVSMLKARST